jgi:hypothetical protein
MVLRGSPLYGTAAPPGAHPMTGLRVFTVVQRDGDAYS